MSVGKAEAYLYALVYIAGVVVMGYFLPRSSAIPLFSIYAGCFVLYWRFYQLSRNGLDTKKILLLAVVLRLVLCFSTPSWSEDYARFLWDGHLVSQGLDPYAEKPSNLITEPDLASERMEELYGLMNSPHYHSVYPPSNQLVFLLAATFGGESVLSGLFVIRSILLLFELLTFYMLYLLLRNFRQAAHKITLYALNPLVIMEVIGNLHFEGMMLTMILAGIYFFQTHRYASSGGALGMAVSIKLSPLMLFPAFLNRLPRKAFWGFGLAAGAVMGLLLAPLLFAWEGFSQSLNLYSDSFEFNASIYYLFRQLGYWLEGYNTIGVLGPLSKVTTFILIVFVSLRNKNPDARSLSETLLSVYLIYFLLNTVVHPWYIIPALGISVLTEKKMFILWSLLIILSYHAYQHQPYRESAWYLFLEYGLLGWLLWKEGFFAPGAVKGRSTG